MKRTVSGNEAIAYGALSAGVKVVSGYPGTPSTEVIASLLKMDLPGTCVEWSTNEKVAFEVAAGAALAGHRAMCTMKMSGLNVAYDSLIGIAYSGCRGGLVIYVADDPGVTAGMCEQDTRGFALMSDMPMLEPGSIQEVYDMAKIAFEISEKIEGPVFLRLVTNNSQSHANIEIGERVMPADDMPMPVRDTAKFTKAGAAICMAQHQDLIDRLVKAEKYIADKDYNRLALGKKGGVGIISVGIVNGYKNEAFEMLTGAGVNVADVTSLELIATVPFAEAKIAEVLTNCNTVVIAEELEGHLEKYVYLLAYKKKLDIKIMGKEDGTYKRIGEYNALLVCRGLCRALDIELPLFLVKTADSPEQYCAKRPIGFCAGCPHRGTYMGIEDGLKKSGYKKEEVFITGDIGCTILGISPPFNLLWTELAMGASIPLAQGFAYSRIPSPIIATLGDSTFFHAGMAGLVNAIQHNINMTVVILDNGWTAMTGMQINPGTQQSCQVGVWKQLDIVSVVKGFGVENLYIADPYNMNSISEAIQDSLSKEGVKVIISRRECAIEAARRKVTYKPVTLIPDKCIRCKRCINMSGCPAITLEKTSIVIDNSQCNNCGLCTQVCPTGAIVQ